MLTRKDFVAKAAEFHRVLRLAKDPERYAEVVREVDAYMRVAANSNPRFDARRFRDACGLADLPAVS